MHPYLEPYHDPNDEPAAAPLPASFFDFDDSNGQEGQLSKEHLKRVIYQEVMAPPPVHQQ